MAPYAPSKSQGYSTPDFSFGKKKLVDSLVSSSQNDIAATPKSKPAYNYMTAPSPFTPENAPKTIGALFGGGTTSEQTAPLPASAPVPTLAPAPASTTENQWNPIPYGVDAANAGQAHPMNFFADEQKNYDAAKEVGATDDEASKIISDHRSQLMGGNTGLTDAEKNTLLQFQQNGATSTEAIQALNEHRKTSPLPESPDNRPLWQKAGEAAVNTSVGALNNIGTGVGNILDFVTAGKAGFGQDVKDMNAINKPSTDTIAGKIGSGLATAGTMALPMGNLGPQGTGILNAMGRGATYGGIFGAANPIMQKGSEATLGDIASGGAIGAGVGAIAQPIVEGIAPMIGKAANKLKNGIEDIPSTIGDKISGAGANATSLAANKAGFIKVPGTGYTEAGEKIAIPESTMGDKLKIFGAPSASNLAEVDTAGNSGFTRLANRAVMPKVLQGDFAGYAQPKEIEKGLQSLWELQRTGKVEGSLDTIYDAGQTLFKGLSDAGKVIGKARSSMTGASIDTTDLAEALSSVVNNKSSYIASKQGVSDLKNLYHDFEAGNMKFEDAFNMKGDIQADMAKMYKAGDANTLSYQALKKVNDGLDTKINDFIENSPDINTPAYKQAMDIYKNLKKISTPFAKSIQVEMRQPTDSLAEQIALMSHLNPVDILTNPVGSIGKFAIGQAMKQGTKSIAFRNSREGALVQYVKGLDDLAANRAPSIIPNLGKNPIAPSISESIGKTFQVTNSEGKIDTYDVNTGKIIAPVK